MNETKRRSMEWAIVPEDFDESLDSIESTINLLPETPSDLSPKSNDASFISSIKPFGQFLDQGEVNKVTQSNFDEVFEEVLNPNAKNAEYPDPEQHSNFTTSNEICPENGPACPPSWGEHHPNGFIKLYNKAEKTGIVVRLGHSKNALKTIVFDVCPQHFGRRSDWSSKYSIALSTDELLQAYSIFFNQKTPQSTFQLKFHEQQQSPFTITMDANTISFNGYFDGKLVVLTGQVWQKFKFLAQLETAIRYYMKTVFPHVDADELLKHLILQ